MSYVLPHCLRFPLKDYIWSSAHAKKQCNYLCAACGGQYNWKVPNRVLVMQDSTDRREAEVFRAHCAPLGVCDTLINALKLLANQQKDGDSPVKSVVTRLMKEAEKELWRA